MERILESIDRGLSHEEILRGLIKDIIGIEWDGKFAGEAYKRLGIDLSGTGNDGQQAPVLTSAVTDDMSVTIEGTLNSTPIGSFAIELRFGVGNGPFSVAVSDLNGDGVQDLVAANNGSNDVSILLGDGDGNFAPDLRFGAGDGPSFVAVGDLDGDGAQDLAVTNFWSEDVSILLGLGDGSFAPELRFAVGLGPWSG